VSDDAGWASGGNPADRAERSAGTRLVSDAPLADVEEVQASVPERIALATIGLSIAVFGADSALESNDGLEFLWLTAGLLGLAIVFASARGAVPLFHWVARVLRLPPMP
jgi:hypothetical protein